MRDILPPDGSDIFSIVGDLGPAAYTTEVPCYLDVLPESCREVLVIGDVERCREFNHKQGANSFGFIGTCGIVSVEDVLRQFGKDVTEEEVVRHAVDHMLCNVSDKPSESGGTNLLEQAQLLTDAGVPAHHETNAGFADLKQWVAEGRGVIIEVNAGVLWNGIHAYEFGQANHAVVLTGATVVPGTGELMGFYVNDSGRAYPGDAGNFISLERMQEMWLKPGGLCVVTDAIKPFPTNGVSR